MNKLYPALAFLIILGVVTFLLMASRQEPSPASVPELSEALKADVPSVVKEEASVHPLSLEAMSEKQFDGRNLKQERILEEDSSYTRYYITYESGTHTISGILNIPKGTAPQQGWPLLVLNHGHIDTAIYTNGRGLKREQDYFARNGFAVLHPDYRDHAESTQSDEDRLKTRIGYAEDVINAVYAVRASDLPINKQAIGMLGHSMGGGIAQTVAITQPTLVNAIVLYAPVTLNYQDSYERWMKRDPETVKEVVQLYGTPESNPDFWNGLNGERLIDRIQTPLRYYHGSNDADVPIAWTEETVKMLEAAGKPVELVRYPGEGHEFGPRWNDFVSTSAEFFRTHGVK